MRRLLYTILVLGCWLVSASAQTPVLVSHLDAQFQWDLQAYTAENAPESHVLTCGGSSITVNMPSTSIPVRDVVPGPGSYACTLYAQNGAGRQVEPDVPFPLFQSGYVPGVPFELQVWAEPHDEPEPPIMADPVFESISNTTYASRTNTTVTAPSGITDGDTLVYMLFVLSVGGGYITATPPSGFALPSVGTWPMERNVNGGTYYVRVYVWYKIASGESGNYTATHSSGSSQGVVFRVSSGDGAQPVATTNQNANVADSTALGRTTVNNGAFVAVMGWDWGDTTNNLTGPSGTTPTFTERLDVTLSGLWTGNLATAGATGDKVFANNSNTNANSPWFASMLVIEPAAGGGGAANSYYYRANQ